MNSLKQRVTAGAVWAVLEKLCLKVVTFGVTLVLARLLTPSDYGTVALLYIFTGVSGTLVDAGFGKALVQKKDAGEIHFNSVFYLSLLAAGLVYVVLFIGAPWVAEFYRQPILTDLLRVMALTLFFNALNGVQSAELTRDLRFKDGLKVSLISSSFGAVVGILLAFLHYGPWALVWSQIAASIGATGAYWHFIAWRPKLTFSWRAVCGLFSFGWKMALSSILDTVYSELSGLIVGRLYTKEDLAFLNRGRGLPAVGMETINGTLLKVSFPALAKLQDDSVRFRAGMRQMIQVSTFFVFPVMVGCAVCAESLIPMLYGNQWGSSVPYAQIYCFTFALWPFHTINLQALVAMGRSDVFLKLEVVKKVLALTLMLISIRHGVLAFVLTSCLVTSPLSLVINAWPNQRLLGYTIAMQLRDVLPAAIVSLVMGGCVYSVPFILQGSGCFRLVLIIQLFVGVFVFFSLSWIFRLQALEQYLTLVDSVLGGRIHASWVLRRFRGAGNNRG